MVLATLICLPLIPLAYQQIEAEQSRVPAALDPKDVYWCEVESCGQISKLAGLEVVGVEEVRESEFFTVVDVRLLNTPQLTGPREIWAEVRNSEGGRVETTRSTVQLSPKGKLVLELMFTATLEELENTTLYLGF